MKPTGIIRRMDDLGRVVIPKEIRRTLKIKEGDPFELFIEKNCVIFKKYSPMAINENILENAFAMLEASNLERFAIYDDTCILKAYPDTKEEFPVLDVKGDEDRKPFTYQRNDIYPILANDELMGYLLGKGDHSKDILKIVATYITKELSGD